MKKFGIRVLLVVLSVLLTPVVFVAGLYFSAQAICLLDHCRENAPSIGYVFPAFFCAVVVAAFVPFFAQKWWRKLYP